MDPSDPARVKAQKLLDEGWHTNFALGSVTHTPDQRSGIVEDAVWEALKYLQSQRGWIQTDPLPLPPPDSW
jgi:hypothetical protein